MNKILMIVLVGVLVQPLKAAPSASGRGPINADSSFLSSVPDDQIIALAFKNENFSYKGKNYRVLFSEDDREYFNQIFSVLNTGNLRDTADLLRRGIFSLFRNGTQYSVYFRGYLDSQDMTDAESIMANFEIIPSHLLDQERETLPGFLNAPYYISTYFSLFIKRKNIDKNLLGKIVLNISEREAELEKESVYTTYMRSPFAELEMVKILLEKVKEFSWSKDVGKARFYEAYFNSPFVEEDVVGNIINETRNIKAKSEMFAVYKAYFATPFANSEKVNEIMDHVDSLKVKAKEDIYDAYIRSKFAQDNRVTQILNKADNLSIWGRVIVYKAYFSSPFVDTETVKQIFNQIKDYKTEENQAEVYTAYIKSELSEEGLVNALLNKALTFKQKRYKFHVQAAYIGSRFANRLTARKMILTINHPDANLEMKRMSDDTKARFYRAYLGRGDAEADVMELILKTSKFFTAKTVRDNKDVNTLKSNIYIDYIMRDDAKPEFVEILKNYNKDNRLFLELLEERETKRGKIWTKSARKVAGHKRPRSDFERNEVDGNEASAKKAKND